MPIHSKRGGFSWIALLGVFRRLSLVLLLLVAFFILALQISKRDQLESIRGHVVAALSPVLEVLGLPLDYAHGLADQLESWVGIADENAMLKAENGRLQAMEDDVRILRAENRYLRKLLNVVPEPMERKITARVIGDSSGIYNQSLLINAGAEDGVEIGMVALSDLGVIGRIVSVEANNARVLLLTDINSRLPVISEFSRERAMAQGSNGGLLRLNYLPEDSRIKIGEQIITSGDGIYFPIGIGIGLVEKIENNDVFVRPFYDKQRLEYVVLVKLVPRPKA